MSNRVQPYNKSKSSITPRHVTELSHTSHCPQCQKKAAGNVKSGSKAAKKQ